MFSCRLLLYSLVALGSSSTVLGLGWSNLTPLSTRKDISNSVPPALQARDRNPNGTQFLWLENDVYAGKTFFDNFTFWEFEDPTHGTVTYVNSSVAFATNLTYFTPEGKVVMKGDDTNWLPYGKNRSSVRITSNKVYNSGSLFILDVNRAPWGCGVWPAWWTVGDDWPHNGEIDIIEGVHDNYNNQVAFHTDPGCWLGNGTANYTGSPLPGGPNGGPNLNCDANINSNAGCGITDWSQSSYGPLFETQGGGVFAMKWDENSISVWSFYRSAIPSDITSGNPDPSGWPLPSAQLESHSCNFTRYFNNHRIVFDITFCGDWAGNTYATTSCPGTCPERLMDPANFVNATWEINSMIVYKKQNLMATADKSGVVQSTASWLKTTVFLSFATLAILLV